MSGCRLLPRLALLAAIVAAVIWAQLERYRLDPQLLREPDHSTRH